MRLILAAPLPGESGLAAALRYSTLAHLRVPWRNLVVRDRNREDWLRHFAWRNRHQRAAIGRRDEPGPLRGNSTLESFFRTTCRGTPNPAEKVAETVTELGLRFPVGYELPLREAASVLGLFHEERRRPTWRGRAGNRVRRLR